MDKGEIALNNFKSGMNCAQAVTLAFKEEMGLTEQELLTLSIGFGGGFARQRLICGAVSAMALVIGKVKSNGYDKVEIYKIVQDACAEFKAETGSIICGELLGESPIKKVTHIAEERTEEYYKKRPCGDMCALAARITAKYLEK